VVEYGFSKPTTWVRFPLDALRFLEKSVPKNSNHKNSKKRGKKLKILCEPFSVSSFWGLFQKGQCPFSSVG
jgi:hypothetical protein